MRSDKITGRSICVRNARSHSGYFDRMARLAHGGASARY
jgi:hypothetical protein